jgi:DNA-binding response OmpR family regulator
MPNDATFEASLLIVEDEAPIREGLIELFEAQDYQVRTAADGHAALEALAEGGHDLVLLDVMMPGPNGFEVLEQTRARGDDVPVLLLTARGAEEDIVRGLEAGADDYVTKPFGVRELCARVKGLLSRRPRRAGTEPVPAVVCGEASIDLERLLLRWEGGQVALSSREGAVLDYLIARGHRPVSREELLVDVWGYNDGTVQTRTVDVHIQQLRAKLKQVPALEGAIETVRGRGYRFCLVTAGGA